jgi:hypothetical protein
MERKLNIGAGKDIKDGYVNHDIADLLGIDVVHDLNEYPWPWGENQFEEILALDILEHLNDFTKAIEEIYRILVVNGTVTIRVPYWNHSCAYIDPTHKRGYHEDTFKFFDVHSAYHKERGYYSSAAFNITEEIFILAPGYPYRNIPMVSGKSLRKPIIKKFVGWLGNHIGNIISDVQVVMKKV